MNQHDMGHQGDVQFKAISGLPRGAQKIVNQCLAFGETSGHAHAICGDVELFEFEGKRYAAVGSDGATLHHTSQALLEQTKFSGQSYPKADHDAIVLEPNTTYELGIHQRYNPFAKALESVID